MNIVVTGSNGFIATEIIERVKQKYPGSVVHELSRDNINLLDSKEVDSFFENNSVDVVVHTAAEGGRRNVVDAPSVFHSNVRMFENIAKNHSHFKMMINFSSGAEMDRSTDIVYASEKNFVENVTLIPKDYYGFSKFIITKRIHSSSFENIFNIRIFNVFGEKEKEDRLIKSCVKNALKGNPLVIHRNKWMDFFSVSDLFTVLEHIVLNYDTEDIPTDINMCYPDKYTLEEIATLIKKLTESDSPIVIESRELTPSYYGSGNALKSLNLPLLGFKASLQKLLECA